MGETVNIGRIAEICSDKIFSEFGWNIVGPKNINFPCLQTPKHERKQHPCDVVFSYDNPYSNERVYLLTDLKSYAKRSISKDAIQTAINNLIKSVDCARLSSEWREKYTAENVTSEIHGMLFVYNHDNDFKNGFAPLVNQIKNEIVEIPKGMRIHILGPEQIRYMATIADDICRLRGSGKIPSPNNCFFYFPSLVLKKTVRGRSDCCPIEYLLGPWVILNYESHNPNNGQSANGTIFYSASTGESIDEFLYIIDYLFRYQLCGQNQDVQIRLPNGKDGTHTIFSKALDQYFEDAFPKAFAKNEAVLNQKKRITQQDVTKLVDNFCSENIGMRND